MKKLILIIFIFCFSKNAFAADCASMDGRTVESWNGKLPHASTADIFYDVSQFASYTALGYDLGRELLREMQIEDLKYFEAIK